MNYPENDYRNYLIHYGVDHLHSKTGRGSGRYPWGSGEKSKVHGSRFVYSESSLKKDAMASINDGATGYSKPKDKIWAVTRDCIDSQKYGTYEYASKPRVKERYDKAADLGLRAIDEIRGPGYIDFSSSKSSNRFWFIKEDQTIGLFHIADLINRGYSSKQVSKMIDIVEDNINKLSGDDWAEEYYKDPTFSLLEGGPEHLKYFAKICEKIKDKK